MRQLIGTPIPLSYLIEPLHLLIIIPDLTIHLVPVIIPQSETIHLVSVSTLHEKLLILDIEGELVLETYEGVVYFCVVYAFVVLLVLELHALEGFV